jgi:sporulation protein YlmC with PRC-barrel domain
LEYNGISDGLDETIGGTNMEKRVELGTQVWTLDGEAGTVDKIVTDPQGRRPSYLVVKRGRLQQRRIVVPVSLVADVSAEGVALETTRPALDQFPDYEITVQHGEYRRPVPIGAPRPIGAFVPASNKDFMVLRQRSVPDTSISVDEGMEVLDATGLRVGQVQGLVLDSDSRQPSHIVLHQSGPLASQHRLVPVDLVARVREDRLQLHINSEHVAGLEPYVRAP